MSGGAKGVDTLAERYADEHGKTKLIFKPDWSMGKGAALARNTDIIESSDVILAFTTAESRGTHDSIRKAESRGIQVFVFNV